jgi:hypothetical protein
MVDVTGDGRATRARRLIGSTRSTAGGRPVFLSLAATENVLHAILQLQLLLLEIHFFEMFGFREVGTGGELVEPMIELVMLVGERVEFLVGLQQFLDML